MSTRRVIHFVRKWQVLIILSLVLFLFLACGVLLSCSVSFLVVVLCDGPLSCGGPIWWLNAQNTNYIARLPWVKGYNWADIV